MLTTLETIFIAVCMIALSLFMACAIVIGLIIAIGGIVDHIAVIKETSMKIKELEKEEKK